MTKGVSKTSENSWMKKINQEVKTEPIGEYSEVTAVFERYPDPIRRKLWELRQMVLETAGGRKCR